MGTALSAECFDASDAMCIDIDPFEFTQFKSKLNPMHTFYAETMDLIDPLYEGKRRPYAIQPEVIPDQKESLGKDPFEAYINRWEILCKSKISCIEENKNAEFSENGETLSKQILNLEKNNVHGILWEKQPYYDVIKKWSPHFWHGHDRCGRPVYYGKLSANKGAPKGVTLDTYLRHCIFCSEFVWNIINPSSNQQSIAVIDVQDVSVESFSGFYFECFTKQSTLNAKMYPHSCYKTFIVNAPGWFRMICPTLIKVLDSKTADSLVILNSDFQILYQYIDPKEIPPQYGGCSDKLGSSSEERAMREVVGRNEAITNHLISNPPFT